MQKGRFYGTASKQSLEQQKKDEPFGSSFHYAFIRFLCLAKLLNASLCCCQTRDRNAERRAGNVVQADIVAELDGRKVAAVLAADTKLDVRADALAVLNGQLDQSAYAF